LSKESILLYTTTVATITHLEIKLIRRRRRSRKNRIYSQKAISPITAEPNFIGFHYNIDDGSSSKTIINQSINQSINSSFIYENTIIMENQSYRTLFANPTFLFGIAAVGLLALGLALECSRRRHARNGVDAQKRSIFAYLQEFDVEDVDLRKSPPGGWHGTYLHKLAYGINKSDLYSSHHQHHHQHHQPTRMTIGDIELDPLTTHSSVARDSLFMDTTQSPSLGYSDGLDGSYDDLGWRSYADRASSLQETI
jgi:hypothetical protein